MSWHRSLVGLLAVFVMIACRPSRYSIYDDFEAEEGGNFRDCGYVAANPPLGEECLADEDVLDVDQDKIDCLRSAWERCDGALVNGLFRLESGEYAETRTYISASSEGGCKVVDFSYAFEDELLRLECQAIAFFPDTCQALEMSQCAEVERIPVRVERNRL